MLHVHYQSDLRYPGSSCPLSLCLARYFNYLSRVRNALFFSVSDAVVRTAACATRVPRAAEAELRAHGFRS
eukprot:2794647-Rhodomonas_salina.1